MSLMNFDNYIHLCNHHPKQDTENFIHPRKFLYASLLSLRLLNPKKHVLISIYMTGSPVLDSIQTECAFCHVWLLSLGQSEQSSMLLHISIIQSTG